MAKKKRTGYWKHKEKGKGRRNTIDTRLGIKHKNLEVVIDTEKEEGKRKRPGTAKHSTPLRS